MDLQYTGVLLVSNGKISCGLIRVCSDDSHEYAHELDTHEFRDLWYSLESLLFVYA